MFNSDSIPLMVSMLWGLAAAGVAWYCASVAVQITYVTLADGRQQVRKFPLIFRILLPLAPNVRHLFRKPLFNRAVENTTKRLTSSGFEGVVTGEDFLSLRILVPATFGVLWILFIEAAIFSSHSKLLADTRWLFYTVGLLWLYAYPGLWLHSAVAQRHRSIQRSLPFVLDLLTLSVEAGMDFMTALQRNVERGKIDALAEELIRVIREIQIGKTRREALRDMSKRVDLPDLRSVVNALVQADELGISIGSILRIQSDQIRQRRFERAEKLANEAPVKMLGPLLFFIFPAVFLVLLGPVIQGLIQQLL